MLMQYLKELIASGRSRRQRPIFRHRSESAELLEARELLSAVTIQLAASKDTTIYPSEPDLSNGGGEFLVIGDGIRSLVQFDIGGGTVPAGSTIIDAVLTINAAGAGDGEVSTVSAHRITTPWGESSANASGTETTGTSAGAFDATWIYASYGGQQWQTPGGDFAGASASASIEGAGNYELFGGGLIDDIQAWIDAPETNFGWLLQSIDGAARSLVSRNAPDDSLAPTLEITYEEPPPPPVTIEGRVWNDLNRDGVQNDAVLSGLDLQVFNGNNYFNAFGGDEYWFRSGVDSRWYFLTSDGNLTRWSGTGGTLSGDVTTTLDPRFYLEPGLVTQNAGGEAEPFLDGWTVELVDSSGNVVQTTATAGRDTNQDQNVDPDTEGGWYSFVASGDETYTVRTVLRDGWTETGQLTFSSSSQSEGSVNAPQLRFRNSYYENYGGLNERWMYSDDSGWYYVTPQGELYRWNGKPVTADAPLTGTLVATPGSSYYDDPLLLADGYSEPEPPQNTSSRIDVGVAESQNKSIKGRIWLDFYANGTRDFISLIPDYYVLYPAESLADGEEWFFDYENGDWYVISVDGEASYWGPHESEDSNDDFDREDPDSPQFREFADKQSEPWLNNKTVELIDSEGNVVASTETRNVDLNEDGIIQFETERGWYIFEDVPVGDYTVRTAKSEGWQQTAPFTWESSIAAQLDTQRDFRLASSDFQNWGGENERWLIDKDNQWYYVSTDGGLYQWTVGTTGTGGGLHGTLVAQLTSAYYDDLTLIATPPDVADNVSVSLDADPIELLFGTHKLLNQILS